MLRVLPFVLVIGLYVYALIDLATARSTEIRVLPRLVWLLVIIVIPVLGVIAWLAFGRPLPVRDGPRISDLLSGRERPKGTDYRAGPVALDDDPDFLRGLDENRNSSGDTTD